MKKRPRPAAITDISSLGLAPTLTLTLTLTVTPHPKHSPERSNPNPNPNPDPKSPSLDEIVVKKKTNLDNHKELSHLEQRKARDAAEERRLEVRVRVRLRSPLTLILTVTP